MILLIFDSIVILFFIVIFLKFKSILLKVVLLISFYPLFTLILFRNGVPLYGLMLNQGILFSDKAINIGYYTYIFAEFLFYIIFYPLRNKSYEFKTFKTTNGFNLLLLICLIISSIPVLLTHTQGAILKSASFYNLFNVLLLLCKKKFMSVCTLLHLLILLAVIILGERVDSILVVVVLLIMNGDEYQKEFYKKKRLYVGLILLFFISTIVIFTRESISYSFNDILSSIFIQRTVCDVLFVYLSSVQYFLDNGPTFSVLYNLFLGLFPGDFRGTVSDYYYVLFLQKNFTWNAGGGLFFSEGMLAFGSIGVILYMSIFALLIKYLFIQRSQFYSALFLIFMISMCRIFWYGLIYIYTPLMLCIISAIFLISYRKNKQFAKTII